MHAATAWQTVWGQECMLQQHGRLSGDKNACCNSMADCLGTRMHAATAWQTVWGQECMLQQHGRLSGDKNACCNSMADCLGTRMHSMADCLGTRMHSMADCLGTKMHSMADCLGTRMHSMADCLGTSNRHTNIICFEIQAQGTAEYQKMAQCKDNCIHCKTSQLIAAIFYTIQTHNIAATVYFARQTKNIAEICLLCKVDKKYCRNLFTLLQKFVYFIA